MATNVYGGVKGSVEETGKKVKAPAGLVIGEPAHAGLGDAFKGSQWRGDEHPEWNGAFFQSVMQADSEKWQTAVRSFDPAWMDSFKTFYTTLLDVVSEDYFDIEEPHKAAGRTLGWRWAIHMAYPYTDVPGASYRSSADIALGSDQVKKALTREEELLEDVEHAVEHWSERLDGNKHIPLIDGFYLNENGMWRNLKHPTVIDGRNVSMKDIETGKWETHENLRKQVHEMWEKVHNPKTPTHPALRGMDKPAAPKSARQSSYPGDRPYLSHNLTLMRQ